LKQINEIIPEGTVADPTKPDITVEIDHVYGFSGDRQRACLYFGRTNEELIYPAAAMGITHDISSNTQRIFGGTPKPKDAEKYLQNHPHH
jgi:WD40 repeat protein